MTVERSARTNYVLILWAGNKDEVKCKDILSTISLSVFDGNFQRDYMLLFVDLVEFGLVRVETNPGEV